MKRTDHGKRLLLNTASSLILQATAIFCGLILPRLILRAYGSEVNGLVTSASQFLSAISFLELGVGAVVQSALYKPLANGDCEKTSRIIASAEKFFRLLACALLVYMAALCLLYPSIAKQPFGWRYTAALIASIGLGLFAQYYFGIVDRLLLTADQHGYIPCLAQTLTLAASTCAGVILIRMGAGIHAVKLAASLTFLLRPLAVRAYVNKHYRVNRKTKYQEEPIAQKWNGAAQHVAAVVLDSTDLIVLTAFSSLADISIYSIYNLVVSGVKSLFLSMTGGIQPLLGELWAKNEHDKLRKIFGWTEWLLHTGTTLIFGCTAVLVLPFVQIYTKGISDANYDQPTFALLLTLAQAGHCLRLPYNLMILAAGHYRQTQRNSIYAALLNIVLSIVLVRPLGLTGVAVGTLAAMLYQTIWMARYVSKNLLQQPFRSFIRQSMLDCCIFITSFFLSKLLPLQAADFLHWTLLAACTVSVWTAVSVIFNLAFHQAYLSALLNGLKKHGKNFRGRKHADTKY